MRSAIRCKSLALSLLLALPFAPHVTQAYPDTAAGTVAAGNSHAAALKVTALYGVGVVTRSETGRPIPVPPRFRRPASPGS